MDAKSVMSGLEGLTEYDWRLYHSDSEVRNIAREALAMLKEQPEIIRCKYCEYYVKGSGGIWVCKLDYGGDDDWYCASGKRKIQKSNKMKLKDYYEI